MGSVRRSLALSNSELKQAVFHCEPDLAVCGREAFLAMYNNEVYQTSLESRSIMCGAGQLISLKLILRKTREGKCWAGCCLKPGKYQQKQAGKPSIRIIVFEVITCGYCISAVGKEAGAQMCSGGSCESVLSRRQR